MLKCVNDYGGIALEVKLSDRKSKLVKRFMLSYIIILIIPLIITGIVFSETSGMIKQDALEANQKLLEQTQYIIDQGMTEMNSLSNHIAMDPSFKWLYNKKEPIQASETYMLKENLQRLQLYSLSTNYVINYYLIFPNSDVVLTPRSSYKLPDFYGYIYKREDMKYEEWDTTVLKKYHNREIIPTEFSYVDGEKKSVITYISSIPAESIMYPLSTIMILINKDELLKPMEGINTKDGGNVYIIDSSGRIIASKYSGDKSSIPSDILRERSAGYSERTINGEKMLFSYTTSDLNGWMYISVSPEKVVLAKVNYIRNMINGSIALCFFLGIIAAYFMASKNAKPIKEIIKMITSNTVNASNEDSDEYNYIQSTFSRLITNDTALREKLQKHIPLAQAEFIRRLIKGEMNNMEEIQSNMMQVELSIRGRHFNVIIVCIKGYYESLSIESLKELNVLRLILKNTFAEMCTDSIKAYPMDIDEANVAFILDYNYEKDEECEKVLKGFIKDVKNKLNAAYGISIYVSAGDFYDKLLDIYYSFSKAKYVLESGKIGNEEDINWYSDFNEEKSFYYYPVELELRLINLMKSGNQDEVEKLFEVIFKENFEKKKISSDMIKGLIYELTGTIQKTMEQISGMDDIRIKNLKTSLRTLKNIGSFEQAYKITVEICKSICKVSAERKKGQISKLKEDILNYLNENYMNQQLSLSLVAAKFDFSDTNLSHFFKEQVEENFSDYIERLRIEKACELILKGDFSVEEIAGKIGYSSSNTFRRAFKRCIGMIPSEYKKENKVFK